MVLLLSCDTGNGGDVVIHTLFSSIYVRDDVGEAGEGLCGSELGGSSIKVTPGCVG